VILKRTLSPVRVFPYARGELALGLAAGTAAVLLVTVAGLSWLSLPPTLAVVLGTALSILLGFRANAAYQRWWDASGIWAQITAHSRNLARIVIALGDAKRTNPQIDGDAITAWQRGMVFRQVAWVNALRLDLRRQNEWEVLQPYLSPEEYERVRVADAKAALLLQLHSQHIFSAYAAGILVGFDNFQMEQVLPQLAQQQALAERIKLMPIPRPYAVFARVFVHLFVVVFPFTLLSTLGPYPWLAIPLGGLVGTVFGLVEQTGAAVEEPFENSVEDVPLTTLCTIIERDLLEQLGEPNRPPAPEPVAGYLF